MTTCLQLPFDLVAHLVLALEGQGHQLMSEKRDCVISWWSPRLTFVPHSPDRPLLLLDRSSCVAVLRVHAHQLRLLELFAPDEVPA